MRRVRTVETFKAGQAIGPGVADEGGFVIAIKVAGRVVAYEFDDVEEVDEFIAALIENKARVWPKRYQ